MSAQVTRHGEKRIRKRIGLPKKTVQRLADAALVEGSRHSDFAGSFRKYLDAVYLEHRNANNMRVYRGNLFLFNGSTLITCWVLPNRFRHTKPGRSETEQEIAELLTAAPVALEYAPDAAAVVH